MRRQFTFQLTAVDPDDRPTMLLTPPISHDVSETRELLFANLRILIELGGYRVDPGMLDPAREVRLQLMATASLANDTEFALIPLRDCGCNDCTAYGKGGVVGREAYHVMWKVRTGVSQARDYVCFGELRMKSLTADMFTVERTWKLPSKLVSSNEWVEATGWVLDDALFFAAMNHDSDEQLHGRIRFRMDDMVEGRLPEGHELKEVVIEEKPDGSGRRRVDATCKIVPAKGWTSSSYEARNGRTLMKRKTI